jgi:hypothetical protein
VLWSPWGSELLIPKAEAIKPEVDLEGRPAVEGFEFIADRQQQIRLGAAEAAVATGLPLTLEATAEKLQLSQPEGLLLLGVDDRRRQEAAAEAHGQ